MACIIKLPNEKSKGVISFTNIEYFGQIKNHARAEKSIAALKEMWVFCYHPNWEDHDFLDDGTFDCVLNVPSSFSFSPASSGSKRLIQTCSNRMSPLDFSLVGVKDKIWDFCHVSRDQKSKNIEGFFRVVKSAFSEKPDLTGILIISVADKDAMERVRSYYDDIFSENERRQFEFVTLSYNLPFPLSKKTLAHFYNYSKVTLNTHLNEPHGRVVGYALASGLPVVGYKPISEMVCEADRKKPFFFLAKQGDEVALAKRLCEAIEYTDTDYQYELHNGMSVQFSEKSQSDLLRSSLISAFDLDDKGWNLYSLDGRLSTHYMLMESANSFSASVLELLHFLLNESISGQKDDEATIVGKVKIFSKTSRGSLDRWQDYLAVKAGIKKKVWRAKLSSLHLYRILRWLKRKVLQ